MTILNCIQFIERNLRPFCHKHRALEQYFFKEIFKSLVANCSPIRKTTKYYYRLSSNCYAVSHTYNIHNIDSISQLCHCLFVIIYTHVRSSIFPVSTPYGYLFWINAHYFCFWWRNCCLFIASVRSVRCCISP